MLVHDWMLEALLLQKDVLGCGRERGFDAPGCKRGCDMEGPCGEGIRSLPRLLPHRHLCGHLHP
jgi:hypothetical protein